MTALYSVNEIRHIERAALADLPQGTLMQRAGQAVANMALIPNPRSDAKGTWAGKPVVVGQSGGAAC